MPEALATALSTPGLVWVALAAFVAGVVRGFAGFGTAMIFVPIAGQHLSPIGALVALAVMDGFGPIPNLPRAWRDGHPRDVARLIAGLVVTLPLGLIVLGWLAPEAFRLIVSCIALALVVCLILGLRYRGQVRPPLVYGVGGVSGFLGGVSGIPGPPVILFYMASPLPPAAIRANNMLFLFLFDWIFLGMLGLRGDLSLPALLIGALIILPNAIGNIAGGLMFRPEREGLYRGAAYGIIAVSALSGLPIWG